MFYAGQYGGHTKDIEPITPAERFKLYKKLVSQKAEETGMDEEFLVVLLAGKHLKEAHEEKIDVVTNLIIDSKNDFTSFFKNQLL